jgi:glutathione S-transferase
MSKNHSEKDRNVYRFKLIYSEDRGKADLIKLIFSIKNQIYEDIKIKQADQNFYNNYMPFEELPVLIIDDEFKIAEVNSICRFLAKYFDLDGDNEIEKVMCDMVVERLKECADQYTLIHLNDSLQNNALLHRFLNETLTKTLNGYEKMMNINFKSKFIVGNKITWADLAIVNSWEWLDENCKQLINRYLLVKRHYDFIRNTKEINEWFNKQKPLRVFKKI